MALVDSSRNHSSSPPAGSGRKEFRLQNGSTFYIRRYDAFLALRILGDIQRRFLTGIALVIDAANKKDVTEEQRTREIMEAVERISMTLDGDSLVEIARKVLHPEFVAVSLNGGQPDKLDEGLLNRAIGGVGDVVSLVVEVLSVNYADLFTRVQTLIGSAQAQQESL